MCIEKNLFFLDISNVGRIWNKALQNTKNSHNIFEN